MPVRRILTVAIAALIGVATVSCSSTGPSDIASEPAADSTPTTGLLDAATSTTSPIAPETSTPPPAGAPSSTTTPTTPPPSTTVAPSPPSDGSDTTIPPALPPLELTDSPYCASVNDAYTKTSTVLTRLAGLFTALEGTGDEAELTSTLTEIQQQMRDAAAAWQSAADIAPATARDDTLKLAQMLTQLADQLFDAGDAESAPTSDAPVQRIASVVEACGGTLPGA